MRTVALVCFCLLYSSSPSSSLENKLVDDVYELLWKNNIDIAYQTYGSEFLRQMESGTLQAEKYVTFTLQDINYVVKVTEMLREMSEKVIQPEDVKDFINGRYKSYKKFAEFMINQYSFKNTEENILKNGNRKPLVLIGLHLFCVHTIEVNEDQQFLVTVPTFFKISSFVFCRRKKITQVYDNRDQTLNIKETPAMEKYLSDYRTFMDDPLDFAVALLPCARLWVWLANQVNIPQNSPYYTWKESNKDGHPEDHFKPLLNKYLNTPEKVNRANDVFHNQMQNEYHFFSSSLVIDGVCTILGSNEITCYNKNVFVNV